MDKKPRISVFNALYWILSNGCGVLILIVLLLFFLRGISSSSNQDERLAAEKIWEYHLLHHDLTRFSPEVLLVPCSSDLGVARLAADLFLHGAEMYEWERRPSWLLFSGGFGKGPHSGANLLGWTRPEAEMHAEVAMDSGVPKQHILLEKKAQHSGENVELSRKLLISRGVSTPRILLIQKPFMERRAWATFKKVWPEPDVKVTSVPLSFEAYVEQNDIDYSTIVSIMVGDLQRFKTYAKRGFQIPQHVPVEVWEAFDLLLSRGFTMNLQ